MRHQLWVGAQRLRRALPDGGALPEEIWRRRHRAIVWLLWVHVAAIFVYAVVGGKGLLHAAAESSIVAVAALVATYSGSSRSLRSGAAVVGLLSSSAILVHLSGGLIEMHFHFFVMVAVVTLYQDWFPFLLAIGYVVVHHGLLGGIDPDGVFNHGAAQENPWAWAALHGAFIMGESVALLVAWRLTEQGFQDALTGLANRTLFIDRISHALERARREGQQVALLFLDLDGFKTVNDALGHGAGDDLLVDVGARLQGCLRTDDTAARLGGDEFGILLEGVVGDGAEIAARRILDVLTAPFSISGKEIFVSASIGLASGRGLTNAHELLRDADAAMYAAKANGKGRYEQFLPAMHSAVVEQLDLQNELQRALEKQEFELQYQPLIDLSRGSIVGVEALVRWQHPRRGLVPPMDFIPLAEESGLVIEMGKWVLERACAQVRGWQLSGKVGGDFEIAVNVSARQVRHPGFAAQVEWALADSGLSPDNLVLEITEHVLMKEVELMIERLTELKRLGVRIAVDDFGTGYSSLSYLHRFPIDILKIDRAFVSAIENRSQEASLARAIVGLGETLGLQTVAEGVETTRQLSALKALGCVRGQGFLFARPLWTGAFEELVERMRSGHDLSSRLPA